MKLCISNHGKTLNRCMFISLFASNAFEISYNTHCVSNVFEKLVLSTKRLDSNLWSAKNEDGVQIRYPLPLPPVLLLLSLGIVVYIYSRKTINFFVQKACLLTTTDQIKCNKSTLNNTSRFDKFKCLLQSCPVKYWRFKLQHGAWCTRYFFVFG